MSGPAWLREEGDFYKAREIGALFGVGAAAIYRWRRTGRLTFIRLPGGRFLYPAGPVNELYRRPGDRAAS